jgi:hypothetical protein
LQEASAVYARTDVCSSSDIETELVNRGLEVHAIGHSHPGRGLSATTPSGIDTNCLGKIQKNGSDAIGFIVTRDGYVRFFTVHKPFRVIVQGNGATRIADDVYKIQLP